MQTAGWIVVVGYATKLVLLLLVVLSVWSVSVILDRKKALRFMSQDFLTTNQGAEFLKSLQNTARNAEAIQYFTAAYLRDKKLEFSKGLTVLATLGSNAPFIGLFGTVLGIIQAFGTLSTTTTGMNAVILALAEALIATAVGLFVAIPAVVGYNYYQSRIKQWVNKAESLRDLECAKVSGGK